MKTFLLSLCVCMTLAFSSQANPLKDWTVSTYAGNGQAGYTGDGGPATSAKINNPFGVLRGPDGDMYFCEYDGQLIRRVDKQGTIHTVAGTGKVGYTGDGGPATKATMNKPHEIRFDKHGDMYFTDMANHVIRKIDMKSGVISTVAGNGKQGFSGDGGPATKAQLSQPHSIQFGPDGSLYICDIRNHRIRVVDMKTGLIRTFAGNGKRSKTPDGAKYANVPLNGPRTLDFDKKGNLWLALREGNQVFRMDLNKGTIHHIAGTGKKGFTGHGGPAKEATLSGPKGIAIRANGDVLLADTESHTIRLIEAATGKIHVICGTGKKHDGPDGNPLKCGLGRPHGVWVDHDGAIWIGDSLSHRIRVMRPGR